MSERDRELLHRMEDLECLICTRLYCRSSRNHRRARGGLRRRLHQLLAGIR
jgi:hypothetical protein